MSPSITTIIGRTIVMLLALAALAAAIHTGASTIAAHAPNGSEHPTLISPMCGNGGCSPDNGDLFGPNTGNTA
jgi:hypothetical protein